MVQMYETQIALLKKAIAELDSELSSNLDWQALSRQNCMPAPGPEAPDATSSRLRYEQALAGVPVYRARLHLLEILNTLQQVPPKVATDPETRIAHPEPITKNNNPSSHRLAASETCDDLTRIRGITRSLNEKLRDLGVQRFAQIAVWTSADCAKISDALGLGRTISRQNWIEQAALLAERSGGPVSAPSGDGSASVRSTVNLQQISEVSGRSQPERPPVSVQAPNGIIEHAARGVVRGLASSNDTRTVTVKPSPAPASIPEQQVLEQTPRLRPYSSIVFSPQLVPEPRRVVPTPGRVAPTQSASARDGQHDAGSATNLSKKRDDRTKRNGPSAGDARLSKELADLPKNKIPFEQQLDGVEIEIRQVKPSAKTSDLPVPPPVPNQARRFALKKRQWKKRSGRADNAQNESNFGDGQRWREQDPVLTGPSPDDDIGVDPKIYTHTEEASVEIVRSRPRSSLESNPPQAPTRTPSDPENPSQDLDRSSKSAPARPAVRIFKALRRQ